MSREILFVITIAFFLTPSLRATDSVEGELRRGYELPLRWDNVERAPYWVSGVEPSHNLWRRIHEVELKPGDSTCVRVPAYELLRVYRGAEEIAPNDVDVALSTGSGLLAFTEPVPDQDGHSLLVDPLRPYPMLAHIFRPEHFDEPVRVALLTSRHVPLREVASYRDLIGIGKENKVRLTTSVEADALAFWKWNRTERTRLRLSGPGRFQLQTRYRYPRNEQKLPQTYHIAVRDEETDALVASVEYASSHETAHLVFADGEAQVVSRLEPGFFELTEDREYSLTFAANAPVFVRLLRMEDSDYLVPKLNAPDPSSAETAKGLLLERFQHSPWQLTEEDVLITLAQPLGSPSERVERVAMRLAHDNRRVEGGMAAASLLLNAGAPRRDYPDIRERWREFVGFRTYYRDALPDGTCLPALKRAYFPARRLQAIGKYREWLVMGEQHIDAGLSRLPMATFGQVQRRDAMMTYRLPERKTHSIIRITAQRERNEDADFWIRIAGEKPRRFRLLPEPEVPPLQTKPAQGEAALSLIQGATLDAAVSQRRAAENLVRAGYFEFLVPPQLRRIDLWNAQGSELLPVAVQYRTSDVFELSEDAYAGVVAAIPREQADVLSLLAKLLTDGDAETDSRAEQELRNHWEPLRRFVRSRYRQFVDSVATKGSMETGAGRQADLERLLEQGEYFLAERLARYLYLYTDDEETRRAAAESLDDIAERHLESERKVLNACVAMVIEPSAQAAAELGSLLRAEGESELALMLALVLPAADQSIREFRLACTFQKRWWAHFDAIVAEEPDNPVCQIWKAKQLWHQGDHAEARNMFDRAGEDGIPWLRHIDGTLAAREKVSQCQADGLREWAELEAKAPGGKYWATVSHQHVNSFRAGVTIRALEREKYFHAFIATPDEPLKLDFTAPCKLRIECRPIHDADSEEPIEGWISIDGIGDRRKLPVITNYRSTGLEIVGHRQQQPGTLVWDEIDVTGWNTQLTIRPRGFRTIVRVLSEQPEAPIGHLPPLDYETAAWLFGRKILGRDELADSSDKENGPEFGSVVVVNQRHELKPVALSDPFADPSVQNIQDIREAVGNLAPVPQSMTRPEHRAAIVRMTDLLWEREHGDGKAQSRAIAEATNLWFQQRHYPELKRIHGKIVRKTYWDPLLSIDESAGFREVELAGWHPENPDLLTRRALLDPLGEREQLISGTDSVVAMLRSKTESTVHVSMRLASVPFLVAKPIRAAVQIGAQSMQEVTLIPGEPEPVVEYHLPAGSTSLRVSVLESEPNHYLKVEIDAEGQYREIYDRKTERSYFVATAEEPVTTRIDGPAWVRIDRLVGEATFHEYRAVEDPVETLTLSALEGDSIGLYRIHVLRLDANKPFQPPPFTERSIARVAPALTIQPLRARATLAEYEDEFELGLQEDGTWTFGVSFHSRRSVEEDSFGGREPERFLQGDITHRFYHEPWRTYFRTTMLGRIREEGGETFGISHSLQHRPFDHPLTYTLTGNAFYQDDEWALDGRGTVGLVQEWSPKWSHLSSASVFFRHLSLQGNGDHPERVDQDIFTEFKSDHRRGLRLREQVNYLPWRDLRLYAGGGIGTNENFNVFDPDSFSYRAGADQLLGNFQLGAELRGYRFFEDDDRGRSVWRHRATFEATTEFWLSNQHRFEAGASLTHFIEEAENAFYIFGRAHLGEGRMYRDFRPAEKPFLQTRKLNIPHKRNNVFKRNNGNRISREK